ncbi:hypothetical protein L6452_25166 [Arctium lappa]|uniref:Uncharacterized protein n=1 Tax=Arctium lappa TaxID=4217 RepID=A0ACB9ABA3_ARCLA|nr:hypothetical protein L6452_25166 [Arctium lappa]
MMRQENVERTDIEGDHLKKGEAVNNKLTDRRIATGREKKLKKMENVGFDRGKVSFHILKQLARSSGHQQGQRLIERSKRKIRSRTSSGDFAAASDDLKSSDGTSNLKEFGRRIGLSWEKEAPR